MPKPNVSLKVSKHPVKPDTYLVSPYITVPFEGELPSKDVIFVLDASASMRGPRIEKVKLATLNLINELIPNKDFFSVVKFDAQALCVVPRRSVNRDDKEVTQLVSAINAGSNTSVDQGLRMALSQIKRDNLENTSIILLSDGEANEGETDPKKLVALLKKELGDNAVRIIPIGIGTGYKVEFMRKLGLETGFRGLIHLDEQADPQTAFTQVKPYLLPRTKPLTVSISFGGSSLNEELGSIECNSPASTVFGFTLPPGKQLQEIEIQCTTKMGKEENLFVSNNNNAEFNPEIIARYYTQQYLNILERHNDSKEQINQLQPLLAEILNFKHYPEIKIIYDKIEQTINSLKNNDVSVTRTHYTSMYTGYTRVGGAGTRTQVSQKELVNVVGYDQATQKLLFKADYFKAVSEDVDLNDIKTNGERFISFDAAIQNREAIIFGRADIYNIAPKLIAEVNNADSPSLLNRLEVLCAVIRKQFNATNVDDKVKAYLQQNPSSQLQLNDGSTFIPCIPLGYFQEVGTAVCRHYAPFTALSISHLIHNNLLPPGTVRIYRGTADNQKAHSWVHYHPKDKMNEHLLFLIDPTNPGQKVFVFDLRKIKRKEKDVDLENAILNYRQRGLDGLLSEMLNKHYQLNVTHIQLSENIRVSAELIQKIQGKIEAEKNASADKMTSNTENELKNQGVIDAISDDIIIEPVKTDDRIDDKNKDRKHVYDRDYITAWLRNHDTSPNTGLKLLSKNLLPAYEEVNRINGILARHLSILSPEQHAQTGVTVQAQPQLSEEVRLSLLNNRDQQVQNAIQRFAPKLRSSVNSNLSNVSPVATSGISREISAPPASVVSPTSAAAQSSPTSTNNSSPGFAPSSSLTATTASPSVVTSGTSRESIAIVGSAGGEESLEKGLPATIRWKHVVPHVTDIYKQQCGFFHWRSNESIKLLESIALGTINEEASRKELRLELITNYLNDDNNKGKRLYDILLEQKIIIEKALQKYSASGINPIWLTDDIVSLIQNKYIKQRGFKLLGRTCEASSVLLQYLSKNENNSMQKQQAIENYLYNQNAQGELTNKGKILFIILNEMREKFAPVATQDLSFRNDL